MTNHLRDLDVATMCVQLGLTPDPDDQNQYKSDGFRISVSGQKWYDHDAQYGSGGCIDLAMHVHKLSYVRAVALLSNITVNVSRSGLSLLHKTELKKTKVPATPPAIAQHNISVVTDYLTLTRGINAELVRWCVDRGLIYADTRANCCFRYGENAVELRGTGQRQWRAVYGLPIKPFCLPAKNAVGVAVLESAIDALSYRQLHKNTITLSIAGDGNHKLIAWALYAAKKWNLPVISAVDNDKGGDIANKVIVLAAEKIGAVYQSDRPKNFKDWNNELRGVND